MKITLRTLSDKDTEKPKDPAQTIRAWIELM